MSTTAAAAAAVLFDEQRRPATDHAAYDECWSVADKAAMTQN